MVGLVSTEAIGGRNMAAMLQAFSRFSHTQSDTEALKTIIILCCAGLCVSLLLLATYGLDLSPGFF